MPDELRDAIESAAQNPKAAAGDGHSVTAQSIPDIIKGDEYLAARAASRSRNRGLNIAKMSSPGAS
jgi:hypothetical protein